MDNFNVPAPFLPSQIIETLDLSNTSWWTWYSRLEIAFKLYKMPRESFLIYTLNLVGCETYDMLAYRLHPILPINSTYERVVEICTQEYGRRIPVPFDCFVNESRDVNPNQNEPAPRTTGLNVVDGAIPFQPPLQYRNDPVRSPNPSQPFSAVVVNVVNGTSSTPTTVPARTNNQNTVTVTSSKVIAKRMIPQPPDRTSASKRLRVGVAELLRQHSVPVAPVTVVSPAKSNSSHSKEIIIQTTDQLKVSASKRLRVGGAASSELLRQHSVPVAPSSTDLKVVSPAKSNSPHSKEIIVQRTDLVVSPERLLNLSATTDLHDQLSDHRFDQDGQRLLAQPSSPGLHKQASSQTITSEVSEDVPAGSQQLAKEASGTQELVEEVSSASGSNSVETIYNDDGSQRPETSKPESSSSAGFPTPCQELLTALRPTADERHLKRTQLPLYRVPSVHDIVTSVTEHDVQLTPKEVSRHVVDKFMIAVNILPVPRDLHQVAVNIVKAFPQLTHKDAGKRPEQLFFYHNGGDSNKCYKGYFVRHFSKVQFKSPSLEDVKELYSADFNANNTDRINYLFTLTFPVRERLRSQAPKKANKLLIKYFPSMLELGAELIDREFDLIHAKSRERYTLTQLTDFYHQNITNSESNALSNRNTGIPPSWDFLKWICQETKTKFEQMVSFTTPIAGKGIPMVHCEDGTYSVSIQSNLFRCDDDFERALEIMYKSHWVFLYPINAFLYCYVYLAYDPPIVHKSYSSRFRAIANQLFGRQN